VSYAQREESAAKVHRSVVVRVPWYRSRTGRNILITIIAITILTIGAALGVILGGTGLRH
jgi:hypothetical protein